MGLTHGVSDPSSDEGLRCLWPYGNSDCKYFEPQRHLRWLVHPCRTRGSSATKANSHSLTMWKF